MAASHLPGRSAASVLKYKPRKINTIIILWVMN